MQNLRIPVHTHRPMLPMHDFTVDALWYVPPPWPAGWEWSYDFPDVWRDMRRTATLWARALWVRLGRKVGYRVQADLPPVDVQTTYVPVKDIREAVGKLQWVQHVLHEPIMVVVGMEEYHQLALFDREFLGLRMSFEADYGPNMFIFSIPVILSRLHSGMVILPDLTKSCSFRLIETDTFRYDRNAAAMRGIDPSEYMPRWRMQS